MHDTAQKLDVVRREIARLLSSYAGASEAEKQEILDQCDRLGGEVQELVGILKLSIRQVMDATCALHEEESTELAHLEQIASYGLRVAHCAGEEVSAAVRLIRRLRAEHIPGES